MTLTIRIFCSRQYVLGIHDLFGTELAMIFFFSCWTNCLSDAMDAFFFLSVSVRHFLATALPDLFNIRKKLHK
jgi:hypothetical protein